MADTFGEAWRTVRLHCPLAPAALCKYWVKKAYSDVCNQRPWSWLRAESEFLINAQNTGTVNVTRGSTLVTGVGMTFVATDADRQFRTGNSSPIYTIISVDTGANTATLDRVYGPATQAAVSAFTLDAYLSVPTDFARFLSVLDPVNNWQLHLWVTEEELNARDAQRSATGTPWAVVSRRLGTAGTFIGRIQYELWPYQTSAHNYPFFYQRRPETLIDSTNFLGPLATNGNIVISMALAEAASWPGVEDRRNPYFNLQLAQMHRKMAGEDIARLEVMDEEIYMTWLETVSWLNRPFAPVDSRFLQNHWVSDGLASWGAGTWGAWGW